ncbi:hypothetical protein [Flavobacterium sp. 7A]|uniref:hypothetical protein n=1 Tax=Flavobacterium sp. 7A TaxID=2940571 RepID=UPI002226257F|nr:hypothetical protein [Flavobacterium sp. 7A]MCW2118746.1 hypothetical protein [Flavobacterium sp. 7A]
MKVRNCSTVLIFLLSIHIMMGQSKIETSKKELTEKEGVHYNNGTTTVSSGRSSAKPDDSVIDNLFVEVVTAVFYYTAWSVVKYGIIGDYKHEKHLLNTLTAYPYLLGNEGDYSGKDRYSKTNFRIDLEDSFLYNSNTLYGNHFKAKIRPTELFYFQADARNLFEKDPINQKNYNLFLADLAVCYDRIRFEKFNFGWKLGVSYVGNEVHTFGVAAGLNANYFMTNKISFSGSTKWSAINGRSLSSYELDAKYHKKNGVFNFGYEHLKIGTPTYDFVKFGAGIYF